MMGSAWKVNKQPNKPQLGASLVAQTVKSLPAMQRPGFNPWVRKIPRRRKWQPTQCSCPESPTSEEPGGLQSMGWPRAGLE